MNKFNFKTPIKDEMSINNIPSTIAIIVNGIDINGLITHPLDVGRLKEVAAIKLTQLPVTLNTSSTFKFE